MTASVGVRNDVARGQSYNVVGMVRGSARPDEVFVYTAHWDHLGTVPAAKIAGGPNMDNISPLGEAHPKLGLIG